MALSIKNSTSQNRWINYTVNGVSKRAFFKAFEERIIQEINSVDQLADKRTKSLNDILLKNPNSLQSAIINVKGGFSQNTSDQDRFEGLVSFANNNFTNAFFRINNTTQRINVFKTSTDGIVTRGTQYFDRTTKKINTNISGYYSLSEEYAVLMGSGKVVSGYDFRPSITKTQLSLNIGQLFRDTNLNSVPPALIKIALLSASYTGSTGTTGTTTIVTGDTGTTWVTGTTTGVTSGTTTGTTGTTETITGATSGTCYTTSDLLSFLPCYGVATSGQTSGCTIWDFNNNGVVDSGDLLTLLANFCTSGTTA